MSAKDMNKKSMFLAALVILLSFTALAQADDHENQQTIVEVASSTGTHEQLVAALTHVGLDATLNSDGPFTVFAPTDDAFTAIGINLEDYDTEEENETLREILLFHVISNSAVDAANVTDGMTAEATNGGTLTFTVTDDTVKVGEATVIDADVNASNGIIHVIDKVLIPPTDPATEDPCDKTIGIADSGYAFDQVDVKISVGDTVCWKWTDSDMVHNVAQTADASSNERLADGIYSGAAAATVDFSYTFTENTTFHYVCEPHVTMNMRGIITVGTGIDVSTVTEDSEKKSESTPGFLVAGSIISMLGAVILLSKKN